MSPPPRFEPRGQRDLAPSGQGERARANLAALELLRTLEEEQRPATAEEQRVLARWSGWGALPLIFEPRPARAAYDDDAAHERAVNRWDALDDVRERVRALLSDSEWGDARRNTLNAHYTDGDLVQAVWGAVRKLGFKGGQVLEPGSGSGNFIGLAPTLLRGVRMTGVEVERNTAAISRYLYPDADIITSGLEEVPLADGGFDAVVGNVPYGRYKRFDKVHNPDLKLSIHDHFVLKSLYATRPGGIVALITSRYTLDAEDSSARERMYQLGDLVGAVRLPARAHQAAAGTGVVTDVLFLRRRAEGEEPGDDTWLTSRKQVLPGRPEELAVNAYFGAHPEYVLGDLQARIGQFGPEVTVTDRGENSPAAELEAAAAAIAVEAEAAGLMASSATAAQTRNVRPVVYGGTEGALGLDEAGNPTIVDGGRAVPLEVHPDQRDKLVQLIRLKGMTQGLYEAEAATAEPGETPELARLRAELRMAYRDYRKNNPPLSKPRQPFIFTPKEAKERAEREGLAAVPEAWKQRTAYAWIDDDPDASFLFGLEEWDDKTNTATEQQVLLSRVLEPRRLPTRARTAEDAIALAMEWDGGRLDMWRVASLLGVDQEEAAAQCADAGLAFRDPGQSTDQGDVWEPRHRYLSGNVRTKLAEAVARAKTDPSFAGNVAALERVQPEDLAPSEIKAKIGAPWIPVDVYDEFLRHLGFDDAKVLHAGGTIWEVRGAKIGDLARTEWGTPARPTQVLFEALLRQTDSTIRVTWTDREGRTYVDQDATDAAQEKARLIAETFEDWVWADKDRAERLAALYNEQFNNLVLPDYSDLPLTLPGLISDWEMRPHQNAAIRRIVNEPTAMLAHVVGAGKTATMAAGAMELRRTGLAKKPAFVVPNHMLKQWSREFRELYPNARILAISASDLSKKRRGKFMARIAGGEWDAVILTHEAFNRVPLRPETQRAYLDQEMKSLREQLDRAAEAGMDSRTVKQIENTLANAEANLQQQIESMSDEIGVFLEDTGIDYLFVDEAHEYKNLRTVSAIPGAAIEGSAKATKLHMVVSWLRDTTESDRVACFATGTWPANSVTEMYVLQRFLAPSLLNELNLHAFDNWAATFGEVVSQLEPDPKGNGYKYKARFSRFFNVPELLAGYRTFADVQLAEDLNLPTPPVREAEGQRGERVLIPPAPAQREFIKRLPHQPWVNKPGGVLKALGEGLRASLDLSLVDASDILRELGEQGSAGSKDLGSKLPYAAEKIVEIWQETKDTVYPVSKDDPTPQPLPGGLQLVFLDEGTPGSTAKHGADLYADLRDELVDRGMPRESIRFVHEANTDRKKEKLFADCRSGRVSVLIGSTAKMGTGTNIQDRAVALHHLSYPWRPADMAQRDGRIERRGNLNVPWVDGTADDVRILYYITERTFDEFRLTTLARKARFIGQIQRRDFNLREIEDIGAEAINLGMLSALASGDPAILQLAEATAERARLQGLARSWDRQQDARVDQLKDLDDFLSKASTAVEGMRAALPRRRPTNGDAFAMTVEDATYRSREEAANALGACMVNVARDQSLRPGQRVPIGTLGNLDFHGEIAFDHAGRRQLRLRFDWGHVPPLGQRDDRAQWQASSVTQANGRGAIQSLETFLNRLNEDLDKLSKSLSAQTSNREKIAANLRDKDANPYRMHARSKEREERALGKLVVLNEKEAALVERAERVVGVNEEREAELNEELVALREEIAGLRQIIADEHAVQDEARALARGEVRTDSDTDTATLEEAAAAAEDNESEAQAATDPADTSAPAPATGPPAEGEATAATAAATDTGDGQADGQDDQAPVPAQPTEASAEAAPEPPAPVSLTDPGVWEEAVQAYTDAALADPQIAQAAQANDVVDFTLAMASWFRGYVAEQWDNVPVGECPAWVLAYRREGDDAVQARNSLHAEVAGPVYAQLRQPAPEDAESTTAAAADPETTAAAEEAPEQEAPAEDSTTTPEEPPTPAPAETEPETTNAEQTTLQGLIEGFGGRVQVGHIGGPQPTPTDHPGGWAITALFSEQQVMQLVSACVVDRQPVPSGTEPTERVRAWIAEQQQTPTSAWYASPSSDLPPPLRGNGDVRLLTNADGITIDQGGQTATAIRWEELPAWIEAAVEHEEANRPATAPRWRYGSLGAEIHFRQDERNQSARTAFEALDTALWQTAPPSDDQLAAARERFGPREPEQHTAPSPAMARCAAVLRYYEPLLRRHKLSGKDVVAYIEQPGVGYSYDPNNPFLDLVHEIGKVGERVGGSFRRSYHEWVHYPVGERRQQQSDQLTHLSIDLLTLHGGDTEGLFTVDLEAILAAPPGTVIELEPEAEIEAAEAAAARIRILHDAEGTEVRNTPRGGDKRIREALNDMGFNWSRKQQKWYQPRDTPFEDREAAVQGLRAAFDEIGVAYTYEGPEPEAEPEETSDSPEETQTEATGDTAAAAPDQPATDEPAPPQEQPEDVPPADDTAEEADSADQLDLFGDGPATEASEDEPSDGGAGETGADTPPPAPEPEQETGTGVPETAAEDEESEEEEQTEAPAEGTVEEVPVQTPHGPGIVIGTDDNGLVLVTTAAGTRVYEDHEVVWPDDVAKPEGNPERAAKAQQNDADAAQAATSDGIELRHTDGNRLVDLDVEAGHGTIVDTDGAVVGWVRARIGDDSRRYWWGQDSRGGTPTGPFHESLPVTAGVPAIRAAELVRTTMPLATEPKTRVPIPPESAAREVRLTTAQVRELSALSITGTYSDGSPIEPPEWVPSHRRYVLTVAQMQVLGEAAQAAADALPGATAKERRAIGVLRNAVERFDFEAYDTARSDASLPPIGEVDPYAGPYQRPDRSEAAPQEETGTGAAEQETATEQTAAADADQTATAETGDAPQDPAPAADAPAEEETQPQETAAAEPEPGTASQTGPAPQTDPAPDAAAAADPDPDPESAPADDGQLGLFPEETPDPAPTTRRRGRSRTRRGDGEPAAPPGTEGAPDRGRLGVYGHAGHGDCDRCGTPADRYTVVFHWLSSEETHGSMAAECASCVELTVGVSASQAAHLADVAEARRGGRRILPRSFEPRHDAVSHQTADNEWTAVHLPTNKRYRMAKEAESGYRGYVLRDLFGVSQGTGIGSTDADELAERAALGRTAETHPNSSDSWVLFHYRSNASKVALHEGETLTSRSDDLRMGGPYEHGPRWDLAIGEATYVVEMVYQPGQPGDDGHRLLVTGPDQAQARYEHWDGVLEWAREHARETEAPTPAPQALETPAQSEQPQQEPTVDKGETVMAQETADPAAPADSDTETAPETPETTEPAAPADGGDENVQSSDEPVETEDAVEIEDPPEPQPYSVVAPLAADEAYQLHQFGMDGQAPDRGELRYGDATVATVQQSAGGQWFGRLTADGLPADVTNLASSPQVAADRAAILFSTLTDTPYGAPLTAALDEGVRTRADVLRGEMSDRAQWHRGALTTAAARVWPLDYLAQPPYRAMTEALDGMAAAASGQYNSRQMAAAFNAVEQQATAWRDALPDDVGSFERQMLAYPIGLLIYDVRRLRDRLEVTLEAARAEQAAAAQQAPAPQAEQPPAAPAQEDTPVTGPAPAPAESPTAAAEPPPPAEPTAAEPAPAEPVRGPRVGISLWSDTEGQVVVRVETGDVSRTLVLPGVSVADLPGQPMPVAVGIPMLVRPAQRAEHLVADEETEAWLATHLPGGLLAQAWDTDTVRAVLVVAVRDTLRDGMAPSVDDVAAWLVNTAAEQEDLLRMAHAAADLAEFRPLFAQVADSLVTDGGSEFLLWTYLGDEGTRRDEVLALAAPGAYEQLLALPAPPDAAAPDEPAEQTESGVVEGAPASGEQASPAAAAAPAQTTEPPAPASTPEGTEMATPARPTSPDDLDPSDDGPSGEPEQDTATGEDAPAPQPEELPLWPGADATTEDAPAEEATGPLDVMAAFEGVAEAWGEIVPAEQGTEEELWQAVESDLRTLQQQLAEAVATATAEPAAEPASQPEPAATASEASPTTAAATEPLPERVPTAPAAESAPAEGATGDLSGEQADAPDPQQQAEAVNTALRQADTHAEDLKNLPEWQELQTVRGAFANLGRVLKERAGEFFGQLMADDRVRNFFRQASLKVCEKIAEWAQKGADKLRRPDEHDSEATRDLPSAEALLRLGDAAFAYSSPRPGPGGATPPTGPGPADGQPDIPAMRKMGEALSRPLPTANGGKKAPRQGGGLVSASAARGRSTTVRRKPKAPTEGTEQAGHLRRSSGEQQENRKTK
ncbi:DEAD/DEAH box helicase family protein [Streptomyces sp. NPDC059441]|uniref:DEAD/DEAH box helicase family protein n=1 Tax=Streptomyces sp. NPDC059441 TaxID=3346829 RepID=UPI0036CAF98E